MSSRSAAVAFVRAFREVVASSAGLHLLLPFMDLASPGRLNFDRPGTIIHSADYEMDEVLLRFLSMEDRKSQCSIFERLLRCSIFLKHDFRFVAWTLAQNVDPTTPLRATECRGLVLAEESSRLDLVMRTRHGSDADHTLSRTQITLYPAQIDFVCQWFDSELNRVHLGNEAMLLDSANAMRWLFLHSGSSTVERAWGLLRRMTDGRVEGLEGLRVYHPQMTHTSLKYLVWAHPLLATHHIHVREQHYKCVYEMVRRKAYGRAAFIDDDLLLAMYNLKRLDQEVRLVRSLGGIGMPLLFGTTRVPRQAVRTIVLFMV